MNCTRHPHKRVIASCRECGTGFCIDCVRETDQTTLCPQCHRRRLDAITREFGPSGMESISAKRSGLEEASFVAMEKKAEPAGPEAPVEPVSPEAGGGPALGATRGPGRGMRGLLRRSREGKRARESKKDAGPEISRAGIGEAGPGTGEVEDSALGEKAADFLALGPDEDFSELARAGRKPVFRMVWRRKPREELTAGESGTGLQEKEEPREKQPARKPKGQQARTRQPSRRKLRLPSGEPESEEALLEDVVSTLLRPEEVAEEKEMERERMARAEAPVAESVDQVLSTLLRPEAETLPQGDSDQVGWPRATEAYLAAEPEKLEEEEERAARRRKRGESAGRWDFLAQPRSSDFTYISSTKWGAVVFTVLMLFLGIILWAVPNAFLVPRDDEYGIHAVAIGIVLGLLFWWKAGRKHSTKLAVQASLTTFFALTLGEFAHWFLQIVKNSALRTIFFDLVSFRFLREHGAEIMQHVVEAMFPGAFIWIIIMPTLLAFIIGFGMPPIPEVFFQAGKAMRE